MLSYNKNSIYYIDYMDYHTQYNNNISDHIFLNYL